MTEHELDAMIDAGLRACDLTEYEYPDRILIKGFLRAALASREPKLTPDARGFKNRGA